MQPGQMAYDRGITVFSPDGRLFQVEYAREAVKKGTTTIGLKFCDGVILIVDKHVSSRLVEPASIEKIYDIDEYIGCATSGLVADARILVDEARRYAQTHKITYNENITVEALVKRVCDLKQNYTQYGGARPFGVALLVAGTDDLGSHLFETDPSGALIAYKAGCIGSGRPTIMEMFEREFVDDMPYEDAVALGLKALTAANEGKPTPETVEAGVVTFDEPFRRLDTEELGNFVEKLWSGRMGSLDSSVIARLGLNGEMFEILLDPAVMDTVGQVEGSNLLDYLVVDTVFKDASKGIRSAESAIVKTFGTTDITEIVPRIIADGKIQLTAEQRKEMLRAKRNRVISRVADIIIDPETKLPHPVKRIELALEESKFRVDVFKPVHEQVRNAISAIGGLIPVELRAEANVKIDGCVSCCENYLTPKSRERKQTRR